VIFAGGLVCFLAVAALVFDVGQNLLDWRAQRGAADAAALAGSRYIADPICEATPSLANCPDAVDAALHVARLNGYGDLDGDGDDDRGHVDIKIPPENGDAAYQTAGFIEVNISTSRPSFFAAVLGIVTQNVSAMAVAGNSDDVSPPYSMLALNPDCDPNPSFQVNGNGAIDVEGPVLVNSDCDGALQVGGNGVLQAPECGVAGSTQVSGSNADMDCGVIDEDFGGTADPLATEGPGTQPGPPQAVEILSWQSGGTATIPAGCPGSTSQITYVGTTIAAGDSATLPTFGGGDLALVFAYRSGSDTPPTLPAGWTDAVFNVGADNNSRRIGFRTLDGTETTTGTWTNATAVAVIVLRGHDPDSTIGVFNSGSGATASPMTTPALSGMATDGHSWVVAFAGATSFASLTTLTGTTAYSTSTIPPIAVHTQNDTSSWSSQDYGGGPAVGPYRTDAIEIKANPNPSTAVNPAGCRLSGAGAGKFNVFRIHPGTYYGGISLGARARVYMAPGTYWLAGGGLKISARDAQLISVTSNTSTTPGRGVFIYDTEDEYYTAQCADPAFVPPAGTSPCIGDISVNGTSSNDCPTPEQPSLGAPWTPNPPTQPCQWIHLEPTDDPIENLLIFVDRDLTANIFFNGDSGKLELEGTFYNPNGDVKVNGGADDTVSAQIIAYTIHITGNGGFEVNYDSDGVVKLDGVGLVH
jgi:hypothetical protein